MQKKITRQNIASVHKKENFLKDLLWKSYCYYDTQGLGIKDFFTKTANRKILFQNSTQLLIGKPINCDKIRKKNYEDWNEINEAIFFKENMFM